MKVVLRGLGSGSQWRNMNHLLLLRVDGKKMVPRTELPKATEQAQMVMVTALTGTVHKGHCRLLFKS